MNFHQKSGILILGNSGFIAICRDINVFIGGTYNRPPLPQLLHRKGIQVLYFIRFYNQCLIIDKLCLTFLVVDIDITEW